jgi:DNA polymerase
MIELKLQELERQMSTCKACDLCKGRKNVVFGEGSASPKVLLIGEAPGEDEDTNGKPFIGLAGQKLTKILSFVGVSRSDVYITNAVLCRPPSNRVPRREELDACKWRLDLQIALLKPEVLVALGRTAYEQLNNGPLKGALHQVFPKNPTKDGGDWRTYVVGDLNTKVMVTYHPSYILRSPEMGYKQVLPHWQMLKTWLEHMKKTVGSSGAE